MTEHADTSVSPETALEIALPLMCQSILTHGGFPEGTNIDITYDAPPERMLKSVEITSNNLESVSHIASMVRSLYTLAKLVEVGSREDVIEAISLIIGSVQVQTVDEALGEKNPQLKS